MKIIYVDDIKDQSILKRIETINGVYFMDKEQCNVIISAANNSIDTLKEWFNIIGIQYDNIKIINENIVYTVNKKDLYLADLSSGERYILYLLACKQLNANIIAEGLLERLGNRLRNVVKEHLTNYSNLIVVYYNSYINSEFEKYAVKEI
jgi:hypothetical protein